MVIANAHKEVWAWAARMIGVEPVVVAEPPPKPSGHGRSARAKPPARRKRASNGRERADPRLAQRDRNDEALLAVMKSAPDASIGAWAQSIGRSRSSTVAALHRLRDADRVESSDGRWRLVEEPVPREPPPKWTKAVSANDKAVYAHLTAAS